MDGRFVNEKGKGLAGAVRNQWDKCWGWMIISIQYLIFVTCGDWPGFWS